MSSRVGHMTVFVWLFQSHPVSSSEIHSCPNRRNHTKLLHTRTLARKHTHAYPHKHTHTYTHAYPHTYTRAYPRKRTQTRAHAPTQTRAHVHTRTRACREKTGQGQQAAEDFSLSPRGLSWRSVTPHSRSILYPL